MAYHSLSLFIFFLLAQSIVFPSMSSSLQARCSCCSAKKEERPQYLYKIISLEQWKESQGKESLALSENDSQCIHLSKETQLSKIESKYWSGVKEYVVVKVAVSDLTGSLRFERNPGGTEKYYHLYDGSIPMKSVIDVREVVREGE